MTPPFNVFMFEQVHLWMEQVAKNPEIEVPTSVMRFYFVYIAKNIYENTELIER